ncbi:MAG TPA: Hsp20/alpha crystallin family protein [Cytophagaceae bacterium]|jgi:HSP20 family protein|nr:Hsp20/alpha crystallin family protein [Cytophagaceae bacterium]
MSLIRKRNAELAPMRSMLTDILNETRLLNSDLFDMTSLSVNLPAINIVEDEKEFKVEMAAPGFSKKDFKVKIENDTLIISAEKKEEQKEENKEFKRREFNYSSFERAFALPESINEDNINAQYNDGILKLTLPKVAGARRKSKEISIG